MIGTKTKEREFTGAHMVMMIGAFFGTIIAVNLVLAYFAVSSWTGLVVKNSYVASQHFNEQLADGRRMKELGWGGTAAINGDALEFQLSGRGGEALAGARVSAKLMRPTHETEDHTIVLAEQAPGLYRATPQLAPGAWDVDVSARDELGRTFRQIYRIVISEGG